MSDSFPYAMLVEAISTAVTAAMRVVMENIKQPVEVQPTPPNLQKDVQLNRFQVDKLEQYTRRENIKLYGIPEEEKEDTSELVLNVAKEIGVQLQREDISVSHRVPAPKKAGKPRPIIAKLVRREKKVEVMRAKKLLKEKKDVEIYITEDLTKFRVKLVRELRLDDAIKKVWTVDGKVTCLMTDGTRKVIDTPDDLFNIGWSEKKMRESGLFIQQ